MRFPDSITRTKETKPPLLMMIHEQKAAYVFAEKSVLHGGKKQEP
jgi:hypothetical protein